MTPKWYLFLNDQWSLINGLGKFHRSCSCHSLWNVSLCLLCRWPILLIARYLCSDVSYPDSVYSQRTAPKLPLKPAPVFHVFTLRISWKVSCLFSFYFAFIVAFDQFGEMCQESATLGTCLAGSSCCLIVITLMLKELAWKRMLRCRRGCTLPTQSLSCRQWSRVFCSLMLQLLHVIMLPFLIVTENDDCRGNHKPSRSQHCSQISFASAPKPVFVCLCWKWVSLSLAVLFQGSGLRYRKCDILWDHIKNLSLRNFW